jgi:hypothetical protein
MLYIGQAWNIEFFGQHLALQLVRYIIDFFLQTDPILSLARDLFYTETKKVSSLWPGKVLFWFRKKLFFKMWINDRTQKLLVVNVWLNDYGFFICDDTKNN